MPQAASAHPKVQATQVAYELHTLGWKAFQELCVTIVGEIWGHTVQSFFDSRDGGRDGAFHGRVQMTAGDTLDGSFVVQCKFTARADRHLALADLADELLKARRLAARGLADHYMLFTNARLTGVAEAEMKAAFEAIPGIKRFAAYGAERISQMIRESARLRMLVPRVYGLGDLSQILDERAYAQAREVLSALGDDLAKFVITDSYRKSARALVEHGFVLLLGEPACGKSTIAAALAVGALDEWGCHTVKVRDAEDFVRHFNPHEPRQFFWVDDAFGATQIDSASTAGWNRTFPHLSAAIRKGAKVLFTSRDYVYRSARQMLKESALPVMRESQVVIRVEQLTPDERNQILYNHVRRGTQPPAFKKEAKRFLPKVAAHPRFTPEIARRLGNPAFTRDLLISEEGLADFVARPLPLLSEVIRTLDAGSRSALALVFMRGGHLPSPVQLTSAEQTAVTMIGGDEPQVRDALNSLNESLVLRVIQNGEYAWRFKHPSVRDALAGVIAENLELMDIYLTGTPVEDLFHEISCGDLGIQGAKVIVPRDRYAALLDRIVPFAINAPKERDLHWFLSQRCDPGFLAAFCERMPSFIPMLHVGSYLYGDTDLWVILRLREFGLLPEDNRAVILDEIKELAVDTPDAGFLSDRVKRLFSEEELRQLLDHVRDQLLPNLKKVVRDWSWRYNRQGEDEPDQYFEELKSALEEYADAFEDDEVASAQIGAALETLHETVKEKEKEREEDEEIDDFSPNEESDAVGDSSRDVFDDVDD